MAARVTTAATPQLSSMRPSYCPVQVPYLFECSNRGHVYGRRGQVVHPQAGHSRCCIVPKRIRTVPEATCTTSRARKQALGGVKGGDCPQAGPLTTIWQREASLPQIAQDNLGGLGPLLSTCFDNRRQARRFPTPISAFGSWLMASCCGGLRETKRNNRSQVQAGLVRADMHRCWPAASSGVRNKRADSFQVC